jgi:ABC-type transporter Mla subunit MlaD
MKLYGAAILALGFASAAHAQEVCTAPVAPPQHTPAALPADPVAPDCLDLTSKKSKCSSKVMDAYNDALADQNARKSAIVDGFNTYIGALNDYTRSVSAYAKCEQTRTRALLPEAATSGDQTTPFSVKIGQ